MQKKPFTKDQIHEIRSKLNGRNQLLFCIHVDTCLRCVDLINLRVKDIQDPMGRIRKNLEIKQQKTARKVNCRLSDFTIDLVKDWLVARKLLNDDPLFPSRNKDPKTGRLKPLRSSMYRNIIKQIAYTAGLDWEQYSSHSLRRTKPYIVYKETRDIETCRQLLGHSNVASTSVYLNISAEDALNKADTLNIM
tara:strand:+ start:219 stop:794 length:576 start_codon:yes stop_codon:yes gene_type:complete